VRIFNIGWLTTPEGVGWLAVLSYSLHFIVGMLIPQNQEERQLR
jgi:hypothetical protein